MPLQGTFDVLDFTETVRLLGRRGVTGRLHLRSRSMTANLFFDEGSLVGADQSDHQAAAATGDVRSRLEEVCFGLLEADRGTFEFQPGKPTALPGAVRLKVETVLTRARKRLDEWRVLVERVPSLDVHPYVLTDLDVSEVTLDKEHWRMLTAIDGRRNLRAIGRTLNLSDFDSCRILVGLIDAGVADLDDLTKATAGTRDLVPTIPLPEGMAETAAPPGDDDGESVTVTGSTRAAGHRVTTPSRDGRDRAEAARRARTRPTDEEKRAATKPAIVSSSSRDVGAVTPSDGTPIVFSNDTAGGASNGAGVGAERAAEGSAGRRRARRRTPGGGRTEQSSNASGDTAASDAGEASAGGGTDSASESSLAPGGVRPGAGQDTDGRRTRRVVRIGGRTQPRSR